MADSAVSALTASDALGGSELFYADGLASAAASDVKVTATQIKTWCSSSPTLVTPVIGVATGTSLAATGAITSSGTAGIGYATGAGSTVSQASSKSTGVTLSKNTGTITMNAANLVAGTAVGFVVTNTLIAATDLVIVNIKSGATANSYNVGVGAVSAGSFRIEVRNFTAGDLAEALVLSFAIIKGVAA